MGDAYDIPGRVGELLAAGLYRDEVLGLPPRGPAGRESFRDERRVYRRGTVEFSIALSEGRLDRLPPAPAPASPADLLEVESLVGSPMPPLLKRLYGLANGGIGPGYGLLGLRGGFADDLGRTAVDILDEAVRGLWPGMPRGLLPLCHWGCAIYTFVYCPSGRIYGWDPNPVDPEDDVPFFEQEYTLDTWMQAWLDGTLYQPWLIQEPDSRTYRGATIEEARVAANALGD